MGKTKRALLCAVLLMGCGGDEPEPLPIPDLSQAAEASPEASVNPPTEESVAEGHVPFTNEERLEGLGEVQSSSKTPHFEPVVVPLDGPSERTWEWEFKAKPRQLDINGDGVLESGKPKVRFSELIDNEKEAARLRARGR